MSQEQLLTTPCDHSSPTNSPPSTPPRTKKKLPADAPRATPLSPTTTAKKRRLRNEGSVTPKSHKKRLNSIKCDDGGDANELKRRLFTPLDTVDDEDEDGTGDIPRLISPRSSPLGVIDPEPELVDMQGESQDEARESDGKRKSDAIESDSDEEIDVCGSDDELEPTRKELKSSEDAADEPNKESEEMD